MKKNIQIVQIKINELIPSEYNPRQWSEKAIGDLTKSITEFGLVDPIIANSAPERKNIVIGGHFRLKIAGDLGMKEVPVVYVNIPDLKKEQELNLRLNKNLGEWDYELLANFDESILLDTGFTGDELDEIFGLDMADEFDEEKEFEKAIKNPRGVKKGDLWQLGEHKLIIGDAVDKKNWQRLLGEERFDFMFTDPPYRLAYCKKRVRKVKTKEGWKVKGQREYNMVGETDREGKKKGFGANLNRTYEGITL